MKYLFALAVLISLVAAPASAANQRVTGTLAKIDIESNWITVRTGPGNSSDSVRTLSLTDKTAIKRSGKTIQPEDLNVGDRVVVEVKERTAQALTIDVTHVAAERGREGGPAAKTK